VLIGGQEIDHNKLLKKAREAWCYSYNRYSHFSVGAALLAENGQGRQKIFMGTNVESVTYNSWCAERSALVSAISNGYRHFIAIAIVTDAKTLTPPCGICRQWLAEFNPELVVIIGQVNGNRWERYNLKELLPMAFTPANLEN